MEEKMTIPYKKAVRVGNFKVCRSKAEVKAEGQRLAVDCLLVTNLDGSWMTRIPGTSSLYGIICDSYATTDDNMCESFLGMVFANMYNICTSGSEALHDSLFFLTEMMTFPYLLLPEKEMVKRMERRLKANGFDKRKRKEHISRMREYRKGLYELMERKIERFVADYERQMTEHGLKDSEEDMKREELAEEAYEILMNNEPQS